MGSTAHWKQRASEERGRFKRQSRQSRKQRPQKREAMEMEALGSVKDHCQEMPGRTFSQSLQKEHNPART